MDWQLADAKNRFSEVVELALNKGPQRVRRRGADAVVVISAKQFDALRGQKTGFKDFLLAKKGPTLEGVDLRRSSAPAREIDL